MGDGERDAVAADGDLVDEGAFLARPQLGAVARREDLDDVGADVVAGVGVLGAGVAETDHEQVGGRPGARRR